jgi:CRP-like cAMP-binding protein
MRKALYLLAAINDRDFEWLLKIGKRTPVAVGDALITEGKRIEALYIVLQGTFSVLTEATGDQEIARISTGEVLGEISFVDARPPSATVKAVEESLVWAIPRTLLVQKLSQDAIFASHFYQAIATFLSERLRTTVARLGQPTLALEDEAVEADLNPQLLSKLDLAKVRLEWLCSHNISNVVP